MRLPRDLNGAALVKALARLGYVVTRTTGSRVRVTCALPREHHLTVPPHDPFRIGTLAAVLADIGAVHGLERTELLAKLFDQ